MALICIGGSKECTGCTMCDNEEKTYTCSWCNKKVSYENVWAIIEEEAICWDCLKSKIN